MNIWLFISVILFSVGGIFSLQRQLQMFQQNSYYVSRYFKWAKSALSVKVAFAAMFFIITGALSVVGAVKYLPFLAGAELVFRVLKHNSLNKKAIKKLVYTARVKRLIVTATLVFILLVLGSLFLPQIENILAVILIFMVHFSGTLLILANTLNKPIEKAINNHYINDAKRILNAHKNLLTVGVTGSYGKTSVKFILNRILNEAYNTTVTPESFNTPMGIVRTVREHMKPQTEVFIAEMGAKNIGDIKELCDLCRPTLGIITAIGPQHLETFGSVENVANTKFELADEVLKGAQGKIYVNFDSEAAKTRAEQITDKEKVVSFGTSPEFDCYAHSITSSPSGTSFNVKYKDFDIPLTCKLLGRHSVTNILGAVAMSLDLGVSEKQIRFAVAALKPAEHRLELKPFLNGAVLIDDAYNSNPVGCLEAVRVLGSFEGMRKILVTPGLVELGDKEYEYNYDLGSEAAKHCDDIILVGVKRAVPLKKAAEDKGFSSSHLIVAESFKDAMEHLKNMTDNNTVVLFENDLPDNYAG